jgi:hypothetical protein
MQEEMVSDELDLISVEIGVGADPGQYRPAAVAEPPAGKVKTLSKKDAEAEQKILVIIELKRNGDETWKTELESFREQYPDYPLPDELAQ